MDAGHTGAIGIAVAYVALALASFLVLILLTPLEGKGGS
jgi:hypothetical protein